MVVYKFNAYVHVPCLEIGCVKFGKSAGCEELFPNSAGPFYLELWAPPSVSCSPSIIYMSGSCPVQLLWVSGQHCVMTFFKAEIEPVV